MQPSQSSDAANVELGTLQHCESSNPLSDRPIRAREARSGPETPRQGPSEAGFITGVARSS